MNLLHLTGDESLRRALLFWILHHRRPRVHGIIDQVLAHFAIQLGLNLVHGDGLIDQDIPMQIGVLLPSMLLVDELLPLRGGIVSGCFHVLEYHSLIILSDNNLIDMVSRSLNCDAIVLF